MKFAAALPLFVASATAFTAPTTSTTRRTHQTPVPAMSAVATEPAATTEPQELEAPPLSPPTLWGNQISDIRKLQQDMRKQRLPEFAPEIDAKSLGLAGDADAQYLLGLAHEESIGVESDQRLALNWYAKAAEAGHAAAGHGSVSGFGAKHAELASSALKQNI